MGWAPSPFRFTPAYFGGKAGLLHRPSCSSQVTSNPETGAVPLDQHLPENPSPSEINISTGLQNKLFSFKVAQPLPL